MRIYQNDKALNVNNAKFIGGRIYITVHFPSDHFLRHSLFSAPVAPPDRGLPLKQKLSSRFYLTGRSLSIQLTLLRIQIPSSSSTQTHSRQVTGGI